jgi:TolA-binding protein
MKRTGPIVLALACLISNIGFAWAKADPTLDPMSLMLIRKLGTQPQYINVDYLSTVLGAPESNARGQKRSSQKNVVWYDANHAPRYQLEQREYTVGQTEESTFSIAMPDCNVDTKALTKLFGPSAKRYYDYKGYLTELYSFAPNTQVAFSIPHNTSFVQNVKITYRGQALPAVPEAEMKSAHEDLFDRAIDEAKNERWDEAVPLLMQRLKAYPNDPEAHYWLGSAYAAKGVANQAILHYKAALMGAGEDKALRKRCAAALKKMKVIDYPEDGEDGQNAKSKKSKKQKGN